MKDTDCVARIENKNDPIHKLTTLRHFRRYGMSPVFREETFDLIAN